MNNGYSTKLSPIPLLYERTEFLPVIQDIADPESPRKLTKYCSEVQVVDFLS